MMDALRHVTLADALSYIWMICWKSFVWAVCMMIAARLLNVEWSTQIVMLCIIATVVDSMLYPKTWPKK